MAIMLHSLSDFGQHLPANSMLSAVSCALLIALKNDECRTRKVEVRNSAFKVRYSRFSVLLSFFCLSTVCIWAILGADSARVAEAHWKRALIAEGNLRQKDWQGTNDEFRELISQAAAAADYQPENVIYRHWLNVYRWYSVSRIGYPEPNGEGPGYRWPDSSFDSELCFVPRIVDELHSGRALCPVFGAAYCVAGQLEKSVLNDPNGVKHIQTGYILAPCDATTCFVAGVLDAEDDLLSTPLGAGFDAAFAKLCRALKLDGSLFRELASFFINHLDRPDLAVKLAGDNTDWLSQAANLLSEPGGQSRSESGFLPPAGGTGAEQARTRVVELLKLKCRQPDAPAWALASLANICARENDYEAAIENYRRALALDYSQVQWRFALATLLAKTDGIDEAIREARICLRLRPEFKAAEGLIADLSVHPAPGGPVRPSSLVRRPSPAD
jgi:tetratricopeptide (TPR) repeat protein